LCLKTDIANINPIEIRKIYKSFFNILIFLNKSNPIYIPIIAYTIPEAPTVGKLYSAKNEAKKAIKMSI
jgi:hypothetical protein